MMTRRMKPWREYIPDGIVNGAIATWQLKQPERVQTLASPSTLTDCPRVVWLKYRQHRDPLNVMGWGKKQRLLLGRQLENMIAGQLNDEDILLWHWKDDLPGESVKFGMGEGVHRFEGTPDLLIKYGDQVAVSDAKTSRTDSFAYIPIDPAEIWQDYFWYKYKLQVTAYYLLCHANKDWFEQHELPLPELCHLFSYALDDGVVRRDISWTPTKQDAEAVVGYAHRWNTAYASPTMPACTCQQYDGKGMLFCPYGNMPEGAKVCTDCCSDNLVEVV